MKYYGIKYQEKNKKHVEVSDDVFVKNIMKHWFIKLLLLIWLVVVLVLKHKKIVQLLVVVVLSLGNKKVQVVHEQVLHAVQFGVVVVEHLLHNHVISLKKLNKKNVSCCDAFNFI